MVIPFCPAGISHLKFCLNYFILHTDNTDCQSLVRNNGTSKVFDELEVTEKIFQCERGSGKFSAICTQDNTSGCTPLHVTSLNCNSCFHADTGIYLFSCTLFFQTCTQKKLCEATYDPVDHSRL